MAKELYIYSPIYDYTAEAAVKALNDISDIEDLTIRMNTPGGNVNAGWAIISKMSERTGKTNIIIDGQSASMGAMMLLFAEHVIANDTSTIMFHKASYPNWYDPTEAELQKLKTINESFKAKLTAKVSGKPGSDKFLNKVFETDVRNDVELTPEEAKKLGIVKEIRRLEPKAYSFDMQVVAISDDKKEAPSGINNKSKTEQMDLAKFKAEHPAIYQQAVADGEKVGVKKERDRVEAWAVYNEVNPEKVKAGIESGDELSAKAMAEFNLEIAKGEKVEAGKKDNPEDLDTKQEELTSEQIQAKKDSDLLNKELGELKSY